ncbi:MAG: hypothetical protein J6M24_05770 [Lachnospiraceae bacterium]|nr:hypothetical protein [Lachnospiraceae bacterium]
MKRIRNTMFTKIRSVEGYSSRNVLYILFSGICLYTSRMIKSVIILPTILYAS